MNPLFSETISAIATPLGEGGLGIVRVSGELAFAIAEQIFHRRRKSPLESHRIYFGQIVDPETGEVVDQALLLTFQSPWSYTGEDVVEFSCHGSPLVLKRVLELTWRYGARAALPGEFTQRAFLNGKLDLAQAEAVADLIHARTEAQRRAAFSLHEGYLSRAVRGLADHLLGLIAQVEATLDFSEEIGDLDRAEMADQITSLLREAERLAQQARGGRLLREGIRLAIVGRPNVGKSSLLNRLLGQDRAIVTPIPGTTRDTIEEGFNLEGVPVVLIDTAGVRESKDLVEQIGVERTLKAVEHADALLFLFAAPEGLTPADLTFWRSLPERPCLPILNKSDLLEPDRVRTLCQEAETLLARDTTSPPKVIPLSALTGMGIDELKEALLVKFDLKEILSEKLLVTHARHEHALREACNHLNHALATLEAELPPDFLSIDLRGAWLALGQITGETVDEEIVNRIFRDFCIGK